jgi:integrase
VRHRATIVQEKTGRPVQFEITEQSRSFAEAWLPNAPGYRFPISLSKSTTCKSSHIHPPICPTGASLGRKHRLGDGLVRYALDAAYEGCPDYRKTGNLRAVQLLLGHTKLESTVRYLGIEVDDALNIAEQIEL